MASMDSFFAASMNPHVLTTSVSASAASLVSSYPSCFRRPIMTSLSTRFFGHPRLMKPTFFITSIISFFHGAKPAFDLGGLGFVEADRAEAHAVVSLRDG